MSSPSFTCLLWSTGLWMRSAFSHKAPLTLLFIAFIAYHFVLHAPTSSVFHNQGRNLARDQEEHSRCGVTSTKFLSAAPWHDADLKTEHLISPFQLKRVERQTDRAGGTEGRLGLDSLPCCVCCAFVRVHVRVSLTGSCRWHVPPWNKVAPLQKWVSLVWQRQQLTAAGLFECVLSSPAASVQTYF